MQADSESASAGLSFRGMGKIDPSLRRNREMPRKRAAHRSAGLVASFHPPRGSSQRERRRVVPVPGRDLERGGAGEEQVHETVIGWLVDAAEGDGVTVLDEDLEVVAGVEMQLLADGARQDDLAFQVE